MHRVSPRGAPRSLGREDQSQMVSWGCGTFVAESGAICAQPLRVRFLRQLISRRRVSIATFRAPLAIHVH